jgi:hypothetical protein
MNPFLSILIETVLWIGLLACGEVWRKKLKVFGHELAFAAPETFAKLKQARFEYKAFSDYIWKREYLALQDPDLTATGNKCRLLHMSFSFLSVVLVMYYFLPLALRSLLRLA